ncbi:hypothetical protein RhiJN_16298 [Ceratobasidium sp. AG-Ba]|nr:hypothetical protein RhiJN_16298 [Ceratobasidium sp. AG-Ba]
MDEAPPNKAQAEFSHLKALEVGKTGGLVRSQELRGPRSDFSVAYSHDISRRTDAVAVPRPGVKHYNTYNGQSIDTPLTARVSYLQKPPTVTTRSIHSPALATPATAFMVTPASASTISSGSPSDAFRDLKCAGRRWAAYPPSGIAPLIVGHQGLPHGGLTALIDREEEVVEWKEMQRAKERADIVVKDGELSVAERVEMGKRVSTSVKFINHIYYGSDDIPKARSPPTTTRRLPDESNEDDNTCPAVNTQRGQASQSSWPLTPASMPNLPESPKTHRERQRASMRKDVLGETIVAKQQPPVEEQDSSREPPSRTLTWFVTEVLRRSRTSIHILQVGLVYLAGAKPKIHNQLRVMADRQRALAIQIAGIPQHIQHALPDMDWLGSEFTPSPLIDPRHTFLVSLVLASKFLLDKVFSNKAWAKLSGLGALEVGKCERALGSALNWRLWSSYPSPASSTLGMSPPSAFARARTGTWENLTLSSLRSHASPARSSSPISAICTQSLTPSLTHYTKSEPRSDLEGLQGYDEINA